MAGELEYNQRSFIERLQIRQHNELGSWRRFLRIFKIASYSRTYSKIEKSGDEGREGERKAEEQLKKGAALLQAIGKEGMSIYLSWDEGEEEITYDGLVEKFEAHFGTQENQLLLRHKLFQVRQGREEEVREFITRVEVMAQQAKVPEDITMNLIIIGLRDAKLSEELLKERNLNLEQLKTICGRIVAAEKTTAKLQDKEEGEVDEIRQERITGNEGDRFRRMEEEINANRENIQIK